MALQAVGTDAARWQSSSTKTREHKAGATASNNNTTTDNLLIRTKSKAGKDAENMKKTDVEYHRWSYERALAVIDAFAADNAAAGALDAALLAATAHDPLPANCTPPMTTKTGSLQGREVRHLRETRQSYCMVCGMLFGKLRGVSYYRPHRTTGCVIWRVLVALDLAIKWLKIQAVDTSICGRFQFVNKYQMPKDGMYRTMANDKCQGYDELGWEALSTQLQEGEAKTIKAVLPAEVKGLRAIVVAERDVRLAKIGAATTSRKSRKRRADDEESEEIIIRGSKQKKGEDWAQ